MSYREERKRTQRGPRSLLYDPRLSVPPQSRTLATVTTPKLQTQGGFRYNFELGVALSQVSTPEALPIRHSQGGSSHPNLGMLSRQTDRSGENGRTEDDTLLCHCSPGGTFVSRQERFVVWTAPGPKSEGSEVSTLVM